MTGEIADLQRADRLLSSGLPFRVRGFCLVSSFSIIQERDKSWAKPSVTWAYDLAGN